MIPQSFTEGTAGCTKPEVSRADQRVRWRTMEYATERLIIGPGKNSILISRMQYVEREDIRIYVYSISIYLGLIGAGVCAPRKRNSLAREIRGLRVSWFAFIPVRFRSG